MAALPVFPEVYGFPIRKKPTFATLVPRSPRSGREVTRYQQLLPLWEFELLAEVLRDTTQNADQFTYFNGYTEFRDLIGLFLASAGQFGFFFFDDTSDNSRTLQVIGTGDGSQTEFPFLRTINWGDYSFTEPVGGVNIDDYSVVVYVDGVVVPESGNWAISADQSTLVFDNPPGAGESIQATFHFYYLCRFITDDIDFEEFLYNRWSARALRFRSVNRLTLTVPSNLPPDLPLTPPSPPDPPSTVPPDLDAFGYGRTHSSAVYPTSFSLLSYPTFGQSQLLSTSEAGDVIFVAIVCNTNLSTTAPSVLSVTSSSGLTFSRIEGGSQTVSGRGFGFELWSAFASTILTDENVTVVFNTPDGVGNAAMVVAAIKGSRSAYEDAGTDPFLYDADVNPGFPSFTITTQNQYDLLFWANGGSGSGNNSAPNDFTSIRTQQANSFSLPIPCSVKASYKRVSTIQSGVTFERGVAQTSMAVFGAVRN